MSTTNIVISLIVIAIIIVGAAWWAGVFDSPQPVVIEETGGTAVEGTPAQ